MGRHAKEFFSSCSRAEFWSEKNDVKPAQVAMCTKKIYWFDCDRCSHSFEAPPSRVASGSWCPFCANLKRCPEPAIQNCAECTRKCFAAHPKASYWSTQNQTSPWSVALNDNRKFWFTCPVCCHDINKSLNGVVRGEWCPYCANQKRCPPELIQNCQSCREKCFASHPRASCWSSRNALSICDVAPNDQRKFWFTCDRCPHEFDAIISSISRGSWCPYCANLKRCPLDLIKNCKECAQKCFASHHRSSAWSAKNKLSPWDVALNNNQKFWFTCLECNHEFHRSLNSVVGGQWCPFCANHKRCPLDKIKNCQHCTKKCFASHPTALQWSERNKLSAWEVALNDQRKFWFDCDVCPHDFEGRLDNIVQGGNWCPYCANLKRCPQGLIQNCPSCSEKCFASHPRAPCWSPRNAYSAWEVARNDKRKFWFVCDRCQHEFHAALYSIAHGTWCSFCKRKTQRLVYEWCAVWDRHAKWEPTFEWCPSPESNRLLPFDIYLPRYRLIVEVDGAQHFRNVANWGNDLQKRQERDIYKMQRAIQNGLRIIRICQEDVWMHQARWKVLIEKALTMTGVSVEMMASQRETYDCHRELLSKYLDV